MKIWMQTRFYYRSGVVFRRHFDVKRSFTASSGPKEPLKPSAQMKPDSTMSIPKWMKEGPSAMGNLTAGWAWAAGAIAFGAVVLVAFEPELKYGVSKHTAEVASKSLQDEALQIRTQQLATDIVQTVLNDPKVLNQATGFVSNLIQQDMTHQAVLHLTKGILNDPHTLAEVTKLSRHLLFNLIQDPSTLRQVVDLIKASIHDPETKKSLVSLLEVLMADENIKASLSDLLSGVFAMDNVQETVTSTLTTSVHQVLDDQDIQDHGKAFVGGVLGDTTIHVQGGDALWSTVMYSITPKWISWLWRPTASVSYPADNESEGEVQEDEAQNDVVQPTIEAQELQPEAPVDPVEHDAR